MKKISVKLSAKEAVFTPDMVKRAKSLGINLSEFAPNAETGTTHYVDGTPPAGAQQAIGSEYSPEESAKRKEKRKSIFGGLYSKASGLIDDSIGADAFNIVTAATNWRNADQAKAPSVPGQFIAPPKLLNTRVDTSGINDQTALASNAAWDRAKTSGTAGMGMISAIHANELEQRTKTAQGVIQTQTQLENQNTDTLNKFAQAKADSIYQRSMKQLEVNVDTQAKRDATVGNAQTAISDTLREKANYNHDIKMMNASRMALRAPDFVAAAIKANPGRFKDISNNELIDAAVNGEAYFKSKYGLK